MRHRTYAMLLMIIAFAMLSAACAKVGSRGAEANTTTTVAEQDASTTTAPASSTTTNAPTTTTVAIQDTVETHESGMLLVTALPEYKLSAYDGVLTRDSWQCGTFDSVTESYEWFNNYLDDNGKISSENLAQLNLDLRRDKIADWFLAPEAAKNMETFMTDVANVGIMELLADAYDELWVEMNSSERMEIVEIGGYTGQIKRDTEVVTTKCDNDYEDETQAGFRTVSEAGAVSINADDESFAKTLMTVFSTDNITQDLASRGIEVQISQVQLSDGTMGFELRRPGKATVFYAVPGTVIVYMDYPWNGETIQVKAVSLTSAVCNQPPLPQRKKIVDVPVTTTVPSTTTTTTVPSTTTTTTVPSMTGTFKPQLVGPSSGPWTLTLEREDPGFVRSLYSPRIGSTIYESDLDGSSADGTLKWLWVTGTRSDGSEYRTKTNNITFY